MEVELFETKGLGDNSYLLISGKEAVIVDPQRDVWRFTDILDDRDLRLRYILETHVHNDYISGALELKDRYNKVDLALPKLGDYEFEHRGMREGDSLSIGNIDLSVMDTPGHTYEHISWIAEQDGDAMAAFTGGSLIVGSAGRTDLLGHEHTEELTELQYESVQKYRQFSEDIRIYPTHGQGSFCTSSNAGSNRYSTLGNELAKNQALTVRDKSEFLSIMLEDLLRYPDYYPYMAPINRKGPDILGDQPIPEALYISQFRDLTGSAVVVDTREGDDFAKVHIPQSYNFPMASSTFSYIGWVLPFNTPILIVSDEHSAENEALELTTQLLRIGYDKVLGYLEGGISTWIDSDLPTKSYQVIDANKLDLSQLQNNKLLDVRDPVEIEELPIENASTHFLGDFDNLQMLDNHRHYVYCVSGQRASTAASMLANNDKEVTLIYNGGVNELARSK